MKAPTDTFAQRTRRLAADVQRLRDWAGGDPERLGAVTDALVALTAHQVSGHRWAEAVAGAQEAVVLSAKTLSRHGPVGPYTPQADAARSVTALVQLAVIQSAAGLTQAAEQTLAAAFGLREQLIRIDVDAALTADTKAAALTVWARLALAAGDAAAANARADAALSAGASAGFLPVDVDRLAADARWAAGRPAASVELVLRAVETYDAVARPVLERPASAPPALLDRLSEPLFGLYSDAADRLLAIGAPGLALTLRRRLVDLLGALAVRRPETQPWLLAALTDLAADLLTCGRAGEAADVTELVRSVTEESDAASLPQRSRTPLGARASWSPLTAATAFGVAGPPDEPTGRLAALRGPADAEEQQRRQAAEAELAQRAETETAERQRLLAERERAAAEAARRAAERAEADRAAQQRAAAEAERQRLEKQRRRAERMSEHERQAEREAAERELALRAKVSDETPAERAERERLERRAAQPVVEPAELPMVETPAEPPVVQVVDTPAEPPVAEVVESPVAETVETPAEPPVVQPLETPAEPPVAEPVETPAEPALAEPVETPAEPALAEPVEASSEQPPVEPSALDRARQQLAQAESSGTKRDVRDATETLVDVLREQYETDPEHLAVAYADALDQLATARWQAGDWWGSRQPGKQAKAVRARHGL